MNLVLLERHEIEPVADLSLTADRVLPTWRPEHGVGTGETKADWSNTRWRAQLGGERARHLKKVLGVTPGSVVRVGVVDGPVGEATVLSLRDSSSGGWQVELELVLREPPPPPLDAALVLALPRPKFLGRILQWATTMGVKQIVLTASRRVERSYWQSSLLEAAALRRHLELGLEQGRDTVMPRVRFCESFERLTGEQLPALGSRGAIWVAHGEAEQPFPALLAKPATVCVGPEGGWLDEEIAALIEVGARCGHFGTRPLRVEAAVAVALGRCLGPGS